MKNILAVIVFAISTLGFICGLACEITRSVYKSEESGLILIGISLFFMIISLGMIFLVKKR